MRLDYATILPSVREAMIGLGRVVHASTLDPRMVQLVDLRASQINGCARCVEMHAKDARALGEDQERLDLIATWREAHCFTDRERAALGWCEAVTLLAEDGVPDSAYEEVAAQFSAEEVAALTTAIVAINGWNRLNVAFRIPSGGYRSLYEKR